MRICGPGSNMETTKIARIVVRLIPNLSARPAATPAIMRPSRGLTRLFPLSLITPFCQNGTGNPPRAPSVKRADTTPGPEGN